MARQATHRVFAVLFTALLITSAAGIGLTALPTTAQTIDDQSAVHASAIDTDGTAAIDAQAQVSFGASTLSGVDVNSPTSLDFGPDGRLYVAERGGDVVVFTIERQGENDYVATESETISAINSLQNHNDDGSTDGVPGDRQLTGITVAGTASAPVIYATSSDPRHYSSPQGDRSQIMDTNSGVVSKLTLEGDGTWSHVALVRGLPRSTELHSTNGVQLDTSTNTLYIAQGGNSGRGAPNDKFSYTPEYAYSAAILSVDLDAVEAMDTKTDTGTVPYKYDLPTLNPSASVAPDDTPFGGSGGVNMAVWQADSPVQVYATGLRNAYDLTLTDDGQLYATDNGGGGGWGAVPVGEGTNMCTNEPNNGGVEDDDQLHLIEQDGYYGHPNPTRGNPDSAGLYDITSESDYDEIAGVDLSNAVPSANPVECDYLEPTPGDGQEDGSLTTFTSSTNGIDEYAASNFDGAMQGDLLTASFDGNVRRIQLNSAGDAVTGRETVFSSGLSTPLDVHAQGDAGPFPGTVWVADFGGNDLHVYEPADYDGGDVGQCDTSDPAGDADGDGYTNGDEQAVGTDPCSAADVPNDYDDDQNPNELDDDDDNDGLLDTEDPFAVDPDNGATTQVALDCPVDETVSTESCLRFQQSSYPGTLLDLGFTGLMTNGQNYADLHDPTKVQAGGAADTLGLETVTAGSAYQGTNTQEYAYQHGVAPPNEEFVIHSRILGGFDGDVPEEYQNYGIFFGDGTQSNYAKVVIGARGDTDADGEVEVAVEEGDSITANTKVPESGIVGNNVDLYLTVDPTTDPTPNDGGDDVAVTVEYAISGGERVQVGNGPFAVPASWVSGDSMAVGVIGTATGSGETFPASYDLLDVEKTAEAPDGNAEASVAINPASGVDASTWSNDAYQLTNTGEQNIESVTIDTSSAILPDLVFDPYGTAGDGGDKSFQVGTNDGVGLGPTTDADLFSQPHNDAGGDDGFEQMTLTFTDFEPGETLTFGSDGDPTSIKGAGDEQQSGAGPVSGAELSGATITVQFSDGTVQTVRTFGDGSAGGSSVVTSADQSTAPTLGVDAVSLDSTALDDRHSAATVENAGQTLTVSGPAGSTVTVMQADTELNLAGVPDYDGTPGYEIEAYEGNNFLSVTYTTVELGTDGTATVDVTVPTGDDQQAYFVAAVENSDGTTSGPSNVVVLEQGQSDGGDDTPTDGEVVYRVNAGGSELAATDGAIAWDSDTDSNPSQYRSSAGQDDTEMSGPDGDTVTIQSVVPDSTPADLYQSTRWDAPSGSEMQWAFPVQSGETYEVRVYVAETYLDSSNVDANGPREYDVVIEGETVLDNYNMYQELGHDVGSVKTVEVTPTDDTLNVEFLHELENPMIAGLEIVQLSDGGDTNTPPTIQPIADQTVTEGDSTTVAVDASDDDGDDVSLSLGQAPSFVTLSNGEVTMAPQSGDAANSPYTVEVVADDGTDQTTESFQVAVEEAPTSGDGAVVYRVNVGGGELTGTDPVWAADTSGSTSPYLVGTNGLKFSEFGDSVTETSSAVPTGTPIELFGAARYVDTENTDATAMNWEFPTEAGSTYEVRLYFAEPYFGGSGPAQEGARQFDVAVEDETKLENYDIYADVGFGTGTMKAFTVSSDGSLDVDLIDGAANNPIVSGIEIVKLDNGGDTNTPPTIQPIADQTVTEGDSTIVAVDASDDDGDDVSLSLGQAPSFVSLSNGEVTIAPQSGDEGTYTVAVVADDGTDQTTESFQVTVEAPAPTGSPEASVAINPASGVDASTWSNDAYQLENTGEVAIESVTIDTSSAILPDLVFDPYGTAGDGGDKSFEAGTNSDAVGLGSTADADIFSQPHNDAGGDDGFEQMTLTFDDFDPGESLTFGSDGDPTSIKGATSVQQSEAGPVSGAELSGVTITVQFADGTTQTVRTFGDGSAGGSAAVTSADQSTAPTLDVDGVSLDSNALDDRHSAATVTETGQTLTVSGPAGATVTVMQADTELNLEGVPDYDGTPGYDIEAYEGNNFLSVTYTTVELGSDGTATVDVAVPTGDDQQTYVMAAIENDDGTMGAPSNVVVLEYAQPEPKTVAEAVASAGDGDDSIIELNEIQQAIDWWKTGSEVPETGGETLSLSEVQELIDMWSTGTTIDSQEATS